MNRAATMRWWFPVNMAVNNQLEEAFDQFHRALSELSKQSAEALHSEQADAMRKHVETLRSHLLSMVNLQLG